MSRSQCRIPFLRPQRSDDPRHTSSAAFAEMWTLQKLVVTFSWRRSSGGEGGLTSSACALRHNLLTLAWPLRENLRMVSGGRSSSRHLHWRSHQRVVSGGVAISARAAADEERRWLKALVAGESADANTRGHLRLHQKAKLDRRHVKAGSRNTSSPRKEGRCDPGVQKAPGYTRSDSPRASVP